MLFLVYVTNLWYCVLEESPGVCPGLNSGKYKAPYKRMQFLLVSLSSSFGWLKPISKAKLGQSQLLKMLAVRRQVGWTPANHHSLSFEIMPPRNKGGSPPNSPGFTVWVQLGYRKSTIREVRAPSLTGQIQASRWNFHARFALFTQLVEQTHFRGDEQYWLYLFPSLP